ncbi:MAG: Long-chain-fatty-acid--CoA ligase [Steroidobacteraceae bacterium]|nr:Long-chain-fatty-acid--CoA ligase [Steroidobacteraceae bacterium]
MSELLFELPLRSAENAPHSHALVHRDKFVDYASLAQSVRDFSAAATRRLGLGKLERIAVYLPKVPETVIAMFGAAHAGCVFVPVNPLLKPAQVGHILRDCNVRALVTSAERASTLAEELQSCIDLRHVVLTTSDGPSLPAAHYATHRWRELTASPDHAKPHRVIDTDMVSIFYTSGSTGKPKGVVLSHRNMVTGAHSVAGYLGNAPEDRLLAVLPFSFDYGFSQLSTAFHVGASVTLMDYLLPRDILKALAHGRITGLAGVPPLWAQLADLRWPEAAGGHLRYITNSGGAMPGSTLQKLRDALPRTQVFLMYGLTEAFRSTFLPPSEIDKRPGSMGRAIPNAEIRVVRPDGSVCAPGEPGELVHRGSLVSLGYWNDPAKTAERFKPCPGQDPGLVLTELAVWSGDTVKADKDGFLYFIGRRDEMIKTSGYRVSPGEVEEVVFATGLVADAAAIGVPHPTLGQAIVLVAAPADGHSADDAPLLDALRKELPAFMVPAQISWRKSLPRNPNGKYDRAGLAAEMKSLFTVEG